MPDHALTRQATLIDALLDPRRYRHPVGRIERIDTHISTVLLAGDFAYKIKKPLDLGFLDFSTLARRRHFCSEEVRLNSRLAGDIYLRVVPITGSPAEPLLDGPGEPIEYAVLMRRFPQTAMLDGALERGEVDVAYMDVLAERLAQFHAAADRAARDAPYGEPDAVAAPMRENFRQLAPHLQTGPPELQRELAALQAWTETRLGDLREVLAARKRGGFIRECHGDLHVGNMARWDERLIIFDGIEFNPELRWIDVISEIAFLTMDLRDRGHPRHAHRVLNTYLEHTGDYAGLAVLRLYEVYRALVRAKVHAIRAAQADAGDAERARCQAQVRDYIALAGRLAHAARPCLYITHGLSGSGKTTVVQALVDALGAVRIRSDVERKRLYGLPATARTGSGVAQGLYDREATQRTYDRMLDLCDSVLGAGLVCVADATFLRRELRQRFQALSESLAVPFGILDVQAQPETLRARVTQRADLGRDASEATLAVLDAQLKTMEGLDESERAMAVAVHTNGRWEPQELVAQVAAGCGLDLDAV